MERFNGYKPLADTGAYPGGDEITQGLALIYPLLADTESKTFIERFNALKHDLLDVADQYHDLTHFYDHQRPIWERLRKAHDACQLNRLELEQDAQAGPALTRMQDIWSARRPYGLIKEADALINAVQAVNSSLLTDRRAQVIAKIDGHIAALKQDMVTAQGDASLRAACLKPFDALREHVQKQDSLAHITQAEAEAVKEFDVAVKRIEDFSRQVAEQTTTKDNGTSTVAPSPPTVKRQRIVIPGRPREDDVPGNIRRCEGLPRRSPTDAKPSHRQQRTHPDSIRHREPQAIGGLRSASSPGFHPGNEGSGCLLRTGSHEH